MTIDVRHDQLFSEALAMPNPIRSLRGTVERLLAQGQSRTELIAELEQFREVLRQSDQDDAEDAVLDVMDFVVGWASPHMKV